MASEHGIARSCDDTPILNYSRVVARQIERVGGGIKIRIGNAHCRRQKTGGIHPSVGANEDACRVQNPNLSIRIDGPVDLRLSNGATSRWANHAIERDRTRARLHEFERVTGSNRQIRPIDNRAVARLRDRCLCSARRRCNGTTGYRLDCTGRQYDISGIRGRKCSAADSAQKHQSETTR